MTTDDASSFESRQLLHLVFGGELKDLDSHEFRDPAKIDLVGVFPDYDSASASDWDVAGADVILSEAGALLTDVRGQILHYNRQSMRHGVLLACGADLAPTVVKAARAAFGDGAA